VITSKNWKGENSLNIKSNHSLGRAEARRRVDKIADSLGSKYGLTSAWEGDALKISGSGVNGRIEVTEQSVDVDVTLGFALMMLEGTIRTSIEQAMEKHLEKR
jgi:putative polyhydroxyalkanoate system protein